jgi:CDP-glucose 4,6-dehydratase
MKKDSFWKNKNVFITGVAGFVGSNLTKNLVQNGANVIGLTKSKKINSLLFYENIDKKINLIFGDITDKELLKSIFLKFDIQICFHLAAQVEVGAANKYPFLTWETNVRGTYTLLEVIRENKKKIKSIVVASSDKAYGKYPIKLLPYKENYKLNPEFPYDTSKACADIIAKSYSSKLFKLPILITRFANIYGPGQLNFTALIPDAIRSCLLNKKFLMRSDGKAIRDFVYINDIVELYKLLSKNLYVNPNKFSGEIFNAGTNIKHEIKDIIEKIFIYKNKKKELKIIKKKMYKNKTRGEISIQFMDYKKLNLFLGWKPKYKFKQTLPELFKWYQSYFKKNR